MDDRHPWRVAELHALLRQRVGARDQCLRRDHGGDRRDDDQRPEHSARCQKEERIGRRRRVAQNERSLAEIVHEQRRENESKPGESNRSLAEMTHVCIQRLGASDGQYHGAKDEESDLAIDDEKLNPVPRIQCQQDARLMRDLHRAEDSNGEKPEQHHWPKSFSDARRPEALKHKQREKND